MPELTRARSHFAVVILLATVFIAMAIAPSSSIVSGPLSSFREEDGTKVITQPRSGVGESVTLYDEKGVKEIKRTNFSFVEPSLVKHTLEFSTGETQNQTSIRHPSQWVFFSINPNASVESRESWTNVTCLPLTAYKIEWTSNDVLLSGPFSILQFEGFEGDLKWEATGSIRAELNSTVVFRGAKSLKVHDSNWGIVKLSNLDIPVSKKSLILFEIFVEEPAQTFFEVQFKLTNGKILALQYLFFAHAYPSWPSVPDLAIYRTMMNYSVGFWNTINLSIAENLGSLNIYDKVDISKIVELRVTNNIAKAFFDNIAVVDTNINAVLGSMVELNSRNALESFTISGQLNEITPFDSLSFDSKVDINLSNLRTNSSLQTNNNTINGNFYHELSGPHFEGNYSLHLTFRDNESLQIPLSIVSLSVYGIGIQSSFSNFHMIQDVYTVPKANTVYFDFYVFQGNSLFNESAFTLFVNEVSTNVVISENGHVETSHFFDKEGVYNIAFSPRAFCKGEITLPLIHPLHATVIVKPAENQSYFSTIAFLLFAFFSSLSLAHYVSRVAQCKFDASTTIIFGLALWFSLAIVLLYLAGITLIHMWFVGYIIIGIGIFLMVCGVFEVIVFKFRRRFFCKERINSFRDIANFIRSHKSETLTVLLITPFILINFYLSSTQTPYDWDAVDTFLPYTQLFLKYDNIPLYSPEISRWIAESPGMSLIHFLSLSFFQDASLLYVNGFSVIFHIGLIFVAFEIGKLLHSKTVGLVSAILTAGFPAFVNFFYTLPNYNDLPGAFFTSVLLYIVMRFFVSPYSNKGIGRKEILFWAATTFLIAFAAVLTKIIAVVLIPIMLFIFIEKYFSRRIRLLFVSVYYAGCFLFLFIFLPKANLILESFTLTLILGSGFLFISALASLWYAFNNNKEGNQSSKIPQSIRRSQKRVLGLFCIWIILVVMLIAYIYYFRNYSMTGNILYPQVKPSSMLWAQELLHKTSLEIGRIESWSIGVIVFLLPGFGVLLNPFKIIGGLKMIREKEMSYKICLPIFLMVHSFLFVIFGSVSPRHMFFEIPLFSVITAVGLVTFIEKTKLANKISGREFATFAVLFALIFLYLCYLSNELTFILRPDPGAWMNDALSFVILGTTYSSVFIVIVLLIRKSRIPSMLPSRFTHFLTIVFKKYCFTIFITLLCVILLLNSYVGLALKVKDTYSSIILYNNTRENRFIALRGYLPSDSRLFGLNVEPGAYFYLRDIQDINIVYVESLYRMKKFFLAENVSQAVSALKNEADYIFMPTSREWTWIWWLSFLKNAPYLRLCRNPQMTDYVGTIDGARLYRLDKQFVLNSSENPVLDLAFSNGESILGRQILLETYKALDSSKLEFDLALANPKMDNEKVTVRVEVNWSLQSFNDQSQKLIDKKQKSEFHVESHQKYQDVSFYKFVLLDAKELKIQRSDVAYARAEIYKISLIITQHEVTTSVTLLPYQNLPLVIENPDLEENWYMLPGGGLFIFEEK